MLKNHRAILWVILLIVGLVILQVSKGRRSLLNRNENQVLQESPFDASPRPSPKSTVSPPRSSLGASTQQWVDFKAKYGAHLVPRFSADHFLTSIQGAVGEGIPRGLEFNPQSESQVRERASEIVRALSVLIGERGDWPIEFREVRVGPASGQVSFRETHDGLVVKPFGVIKVDLGPQGEVLAVYSDYASQVQSVVPAVLSEDEVQERARSILGRQNLAKLSLSAMRPGEKIIWVSGDTARVAYEYFVEGRNVVIDAQTGRTVLFRDRRHF